MNKFLFKLQWKTLIPAQLIGYSLSLLFGIGIVLISIQLYKDVNTLFLKETEVFGTNALVINKRVSIFKTANKERVYFSDEELSALEEQSFVAGTTKFNSANFKVRAFADNLDEFSGFYTDMFFESIPNDYLDIAEEDWDWDSLENFIPIVIPGHYLKLYNFGFAESQGLPILSENTIAQVQFSIEVLGNGQRDTFQSRIVAFTDKINSILVPNDFLIWANKKYGVDKSQKASRILIELNNATDEAILKFFNENEYAVNQEKLEFSKLIFFFKFLFVFIISIAIVIVVISVSSILLGINLIIQKNRSMILNLYNIGYNFKQISLFYRLIISLFSLVVIGLSVTIGGIVRNYYTIKIEDFFDLSTENSSIPLWGLIIGVFLVLIYNILIKRRIRLEISSSF